jgi:hypothetical protein
MFIRLMLAPHAHQILLMQPVFFAARLMFAVLSMISV